MRKIIFALMGIFLLSGCEEHLPDNENRESESLFDQLKRSGDISGLLEPFTLIDRPQYQTVDSVKHLQDEDLVLLFKKEGEVYVYAHEYMDVEVVNETSGGHPIAITFCPLTRSGLAWDRVVVQDTMLLTASGYLLRENLIPLDTRDSSLFSQMLSEGVAGDKEGQKMKNLPLIETKWSTVKSYFSDAYVFDQEESIRVCGDPENHVTQSYGSSSLKSASATDPHYFGIPGKQGVVLFSYDLFPGEIYTHEAMDLYGSRRMLYLAGSEEHRYIVAFQSSYVLQPLEDNFPVILEDETGSRWDIFGEAVSGPRKGEFLSSPDSYVALDWAWELFYGELKFYNPLNPLEN